MRILATGNPLQRQRGFSLLEMMAVLVILALSSALIIATVPDGQRQQVQLLGERLQLAAEQARQEAQRSGQILALELMADGYRFSRYLIDRWQPLDGPDLLAPRTIDKTLRWQLALHQSPVIAQQTEVQRVMFWPDGTLTPFDLQLLSGQTPVGRLSGELWQMSWTRHKADS